MYFNKKNEKNSFFFPSPPDFAWSFDLLVLQNPIIAIRKSSYFCRAALALTRNLPSTEEFKQINQERERIEQLGAIVLPTMVRSALTKRNPKLMSTNELENLVVQNLKDGAIWVACENFSLDQFSLYHPSLPIFH